MAWAALWGVIRSGAWCMEMTSKWPLGWLSPGKICRESTPGPAGCWALACRCGDVWVTAQRLGGGVLVVDFGAERGYCEVKSQLVGVWDWLRGRVGID